MTLERLLKPRDVAGLLQVSYKKVLALVHTGDLPCIPIGGQYRFRADEVAAWLSKKGGRP